MKIKIFYFTGTGNSLLIANELERTFNNEGHESQLINIEKVTIPDCSNCDMIGLVFPVAMQSTFPNVWAFVKSMPEAKGTKIFMADTLMSFSGGVVGPIKKVLDKKGYDCIGSAEIKMANSMMTEDKDVDCKSISDLAVKEAGSYANDLLDGKTEWAKPSISQTIMKSFSNGRLLWTINSKKIKINDDECNRCGLCINVCPVNAMKLKEDNVLINYKECISCMRCANYCPTNAIYYGNKRILQKKVVGVSEFNK